MGTATGFGDQTIQYLLGMPLMIIQSFGAGYLNRKQMTPDYIPK